MGFDSMAKKTIANEGMKGISLPTMVRCTTVGTK